MSFTRSSNPICSKNIFQSHSFFIINKYASKKQYMINPRTFAKKSTTDNSDSSQQLSNSSTIKKKSLLFSSKQLPNSTTELIIQSAIGVFALGFIDAGYSGDWSRIGVISRGTEDLLKTAAFFVVPLCVSIILFLSKTEDDDDDDDDDDDA